MSTRPEESLDKMVAALKETTGRTLEEWKAIIHEKGLVKHGEVMSFLKTEHGISHGYANQIALRRNEESSTASELDPIDAVFANRQLARELYDLLVGKIQSFGPDVDIAPKKAYISVRRKKQFAILQPAAARLDIGINFASKEASGRLEPSGSFNAMLSHRVKVSSAAEIDDELIEWLHEAYSSA